MDDLVGECDEGRRSVGLAAGQQLVQHDADRPLVGPVIDPASRQHLRGQIARGAQDQAGLGHVRLAQPGDAEVHDLQAPVRQQADVGGLDIPVDHPPLVGVVEAAADLDHDLHLFLDAARDLQGLGEVLPLEQLHGDEQSALEVPGFEDGDDVGMLKPGRGARLPVEALLGLLAFQHIADDGLESHQAVEAGIPGLVDGPHAPLAQSVEDLEFTDSPRCGGRLGQGCLSCERDHSRGGPGRRGA